MTPGIDIRSAVADHALFGSLFADATWSRWRTFLSSLLGLPMPEAELAVFRHHTGRSVAPAEPFREAALICGRRGGKSRVLALLAVYLACFRDYTPYVAPGEVPTVAVIAADRRQARVILSYVTGLLRAVPLLAGQIADELVESVALKSGVVVEIHTGSIGAPRGRTFVAVLADEIAFWKSDDSANPDAEVIRAVRPALATIPGSMLLMASSPYAKRGVLWNTFRRHWGHDDSPTLVWRGTTLEMNPGLDPAVVEAAREEDPEAARAEYDAEFRDDIAAFVSREAVDGCVVPGRLELPPLPGVRYAAFVDPSGGSADSMTLAICHAEGGARVLDCVREVRPPFSPEAVVRDFAALLKTYRLVSVTGDRYAGEWPRERFREHGIRYEIADRPKGDIYRDSLPLLNAKQLELLDLPRLAAQLVGLERRTARGGRDSIDHAPGGHDDVANAALGALLLSGSRRVMYISPEALRSV